MSNEPEPHPTLHHRTDAALAQLVGRYRVTLNEDRDRALALDPPPSPTFLRVVRLVPDGTDGESLTLVLTDDGGVAVHVRRSLVLALAADAPDFAQRLLAIADDLGWARRS